MYINISSRGFGNIFVRTMESLEFHIKMIWCLEIWPCESQIAFCMPNTKATCDS